MEQPNTPVRNLDQEVENKKTAEFEKELLALQAKYNKVIVPIIHHTMFGDMLDIAYMDRKAYEAQLKAGLVASGAKKAE